MSIALRACLAVLPALLANPAFAEGFRGDIHAGLDRLGSDGETQQGATYGLTLSYDLPRKPAIMGLQVDLDATNNRSCRNGVLIAGDRACIAGGRDSAVSLRLGTKLGRTAAIISSIGYANGRFEASYVGAGVRTSTHETLDGVRIGVGLRIDVGRRMYARADYRYTNYEQGVSRSQGLMGIGLIF